MQRTAATSDAHAIAKFVERLGERWQESLSRATPSISRLPGTLRPIPGRALTFFSKSSQRLRAKRMRL